MRRALRIAPAALLWLAATAGAQDAATTLSRLADRSTHVVVARVLANRSDGEVRSVTLRVVDVLAGTPPRLVTLSEPDGLGCGRALVGVAPGSGHLAFLAERNGRIALTSSGARSLPRMTPGLVDHVATLLRTRDPAARVPVWIAALAADDDRIRRDAAHDLARATATVPANAGPTIATALARAVDGAPAPELLDLATTAARAGADSALDVLLPALLRFDDDVGARRHRAAVAAAVTRFPTGRIVERLRPWISSADPHAGDAALALVEVADPELATAIAPTVLSALTDATRDSAGVALVRAGVPAAMLSDAADADTVLRWQRAALRHRFRSIDPGPIR